MTTDSFNSARTYTGGSTFWLNTIRTNDEWRSARDDGPAAWLSLLRRPRYTL